MIPTTLLRQALQTHLNWHGARLSFLAHFLVALYRVKTVNLVELASAFGVQASSESHYKRLQRFFRSFEEGYQGFAKHHVGACLPTKKPRNQPLPKEEKQHN